ncbi:MAG: hypothetical protein K8S27_12635 [Candidatus Omnitrophica bacterium]|nr:hypothetical protein [Candidatus Omnitrophota bacterium]
MMTDYELRMRWEPAALEKYNVMIGKIPIFHREMTKRVVPPKAEINAQERQADQVEEVDIVKTFIEEVPKAFYSLMIRLMDEVGFDRSQYKSQGESE